MSDVSTWFNWNMLLVIFSFACWFLFISLIRKAMTSSFVRSIKLKFRVFFYFLFIFFFCHLFKNLGCILIKLFFLKRVKIIMPFIYNFNIILIFFTNLCSLSSNDLQYFLFKISCLGTLDKRLTIFLFIIFSRMMWQSSKECYPTPHLVQNFKSILSFRGKYGLKWSLIETYITFRFSSLTTKYITSIFIFSTTVIKSSLMIIVVISVISGILLILVYCLGMINLMVIRFILHV